MLKNAGFTPHFLMAIVLPVFLMVAGFALLVVPATAAVAAAILLAAGGVGFRGVAEVPDGGLQFLRVGLFRIVGDAHLGGGQVVVYVLHTLFVGDVVFNLVLAGLAGAVGLENDILFFSAVLCLQCRDEEQAGNY